MDLGWFELSFAVKDIARTTEFYELLGFEVLGRSFAGRVVTLRKGDCRICLYEGFLNPPETQLTFWQGDVGAIRAHLEARGLTFETQPARAEGDSSGGAGAMLRDPDGRLLYFVHIPGVEREGS